MLKIIGRFYSTFKLMLLVFTNNILFSFYFFENHYLTIRNHLRFFLIMMITTMITAMMITKATITIMIVVILSFLGSAARGVMLFSEIEFWKLNQ